MELEPRAIYALSPQQFRQFALLCCRRLAHLTKDRRLAKALKKLEQSLGPPMDERMRRDAHNAANSAYTEIARRDNGFSTEAAIACTFVCASESFANTNLLGNFEAALSKAEFLTRDEIRKMEFELMVQVKLSKPGG